MRHLRGWWRALCLATWVNYVVNSHTLGSTTTISSICRAEFERDRIRSLCPLYPQVRRAMPPQEPHRGWALGHSDLISKGSRSIVLLTAGLSGPAGAVCSSAF